MDKKSLFTGEGIFSVGLAILGAAVTAGAVQLGFGSLQQPGAGLFPFVAGVVILASALWSITTELGKPNVGAALTVNKDALKTLAVLIATFAGWILLMPVAGYVVVTFAAVFAFAKVLGIKGLLKPLILSASSSLAIYILFDRMLYLDLPRGFLA